MTTWFQTEKRCADRTTPTRVGQIALVAFTMLGWTASAHAQDHDAGMANAMGVIDRIHNQYKALPPLVGRATSVGALGDASLVRCLEALKSPGTRVSGAGDCLEAQGHFFAAKKLAPRIANPEKALELLLAVARTYRTYVPLKAESKGAGGDSFAAARESAKPHLARAAEMIAILKRRQRFEPAFLLLEQGVGELDPVEAVGPLRLLHAWSVTQPMAAADPNAPALNAAVLAYSVMAKAYAAAREAKRAK
jgi:hypothetical protein